VPLVRLLVRLHANQEHPNRVEHVAAGTYATNAGTRNLAERSNDLEVYQPLEDPATRGGAAAFSKLMKVQAF
jgi:hypothetical protein